MLGKLTAYPPRDMTKGRGETMATDMTPEDTDAFASGDAPMLVDAT
jgi:hypothetical protein